MTLPPQQAKTQRMMRLKIRSSPIEDEGGQQPITVVFTTKVEARMKFFSCFIYIATLESDIGWERGNQIVPFLPRSILMFPRNLKRPPIGPN